MAAALAYDRAPMPSLRNVLLLALTAGLGIAAFLFSRMGTVISDGPADADAETVIVRSVDTAQGPPRATAPRDLLPSIDEGQGEGPAQPLRVGGTTVIHPLELELTLSLPSAIEVPEGGQKIKTGADARLVGRVTGEGARPMAATVTFLYGPNEGRVLRTDSGGHYGASDLWPGLSIVRIKTSTGLQVEREVPLMRLARAELNIAFAHMSILAGIVKDRRGVAVKGAEVTVDGRLTYTDQSGIFSVANVPAGSPLVIVRHPGYAAARRVFGLAMRTQTLPESVPITLMKEASLKIAVGSRAGVEGDSYAILMPASGPGIGSGETGFPWQSVNPVVIPRSGVATIEGLPETTVTVRVFHAGAKTVPASKVVRLSSGRTATARLDLQPAPSITGRVLADGEPVAGARVAIEAANQMQATMQGVGEFKPYKLVRLALPRVPTAFTEAVTGKDGSFQFSRDPDGLATYYVSARSADGELTGVAAVAPGATGVTVRLTPAADDTGSLEFDLPGRFQGLPVKVTVNGAPRDPFVLRPGEPLLIDGLEPGTWLPTARWNSTVLLSKTAAVVKPGLVATPLTIDLPRGAIAGQTEEERSRATQ